MHRLIYTSTAYQLMTDRELTTILRSARKYNAQHEITGLLIYHDGCFLQILEGPEADVRRCYRRIQLDKRHKQCILLGDEPVVSRIFPTWWMAHNKFDDLEPYQRKQFVDLQLFAKTASNLPLLENRKVGAILMAFLSTFRDLEYSASA